MDSWTEKQLLSMRAGGNQSCRDFLSQHGVVMDHTKTGSLKDRYDTPAAELYRQIIKARVEGRPEPTELPQATKALPPTDWEKRPMQGFGSGPHPDQERKRHRRAIAIGIVGSAVAVAAGILLKR
jgi:ADP-ribosylation factor GTPase-activating protein 1